MIDDVWICNDVPAGQPLRVPEGQRVKRLFTKDPSNGHTVESFMVYKGFTALTVTPETRTVTLRLSTPRMDGSFHNFPLKPLPFGVDSMNLDTPGSFVIETTGWRSFPPLASWPVNRVSFALDVDVGDGNVRSTQSALRAIRRAYSSASTAWNDQRGELTGVQFGSKAANYRAIFYDKEAEIMNRITHLVRRRQPFGSGRIDERRELAQRARGFIRFEVVLRGAVEVRKPFGLQPGQLPTLKLIGLGPTLITSTQAYWAKPSSRTTHSS